MKRMGDEVWQLSKDSADAATATGSFQLVNLISKGQRPEVRRKRESKKRNQNRNRGSLITVGILGQPRRQKPREKYTLV